ncbi:MAG: hypothetical protein IKJ65_11805 [Clostridia bacterium]|nr:hypothetical protein [Clostridia bacterium]
MLKRIVALCCVLLMSLSALSEIGNIDDLTYEELYELHSRIVQKMAVIESGEVVYQQDGFAITWVGFNQWRDYGLIVTNQSGQDWHFAVIGFGINGIKVDPASNGASVEFPNGMSLYTAGYNSWLFGREIYDELNITHVHEIYVQIGLYEKSGQRFIAEPDRVISLSFPVDEEVPILPN